MQRSRVGTPADNGRLWRSGNDDPNRLHRDDLSWLHFATLSEGAQAVRSSVDGGRPAPIDPLCRLGRAQRLDQSYFAQRPIIPFMGSAAVAYGSCAMCGTTAVQREPPSEVAQRLTSSLVRGLVPSTMASLALNRRSGPLKPPVSPMRGLTGAQLVPPSRLTKRELRTPNTKTVLAETATTPAR
jgi:hypothetical protein